MSCLFNAIGVRLNIPGHEVRADICKYLEQHHDQVVDDLPLKTWIEASEDITYQEYLKDMRQQHSWGGFVEIVAACLLYNVGVIVHFNEEKIHIGEDRSTQLHLHYTGNHFQ